MLFSLKLCSIILITISILFQAIIKAEISYLSLIRFGPLPDEADPTQEISSSFE